ncbi:MAG: proline dehydrogenase family protein [Ignavibacteriae bacterium]|nr:proline dehydrogenase family protein [Ignavibacteriota bacterium]
MNPINKLLVGVMPIFPKKLVRVFANRYIAGDKLSEAIEKVTSLNAKNILATTDVLGESIKDKNEAIQSKDESIEVLNAINKTRVNSNLSVKLTMLGLNIDFDLCLSLVTEILECAKSYNNFVRIDMEDSSVTEATIKIFEEVRKKFNNVGLVLQAYMRRSEKDILRLTEEKANFRLCKGIYIEPESIAYKGKQEVRDNFLKLLKLMFEKKAYVGIATHDDYLIEGAKKIIFEYGLKKDEYEFQMLLGVKEKLRDKIVAGEDKMRVYVPFGERWYQYSIRRFKENPNVAFQVVKALFSR